MAGVNTNVTAERPVVTVGRFFEAGRERLKMEIVSASGRMDRVIGEPIAYRPGLALTGFYEHYARERIQVIGLMEHAYLSSLSPEVRRERIKELFAREIPCIIFCCGTLVFPEVLTEAERYHTLVCRSELLTREFMYWSTFVLEDLEAPRCKVYGTFVAVAGMGVLLEGEPGIGKSEAALGLIKRGHALVADDLTELSRDEHGRLIGRASPATKNFMEIRGIGIINVPAMFGVGAVLDEKALDFVVTLKFRQPQTDADLDRTGSDELKRIFLGVEVPQLLIPVAPGRDLVNLVETAAQAHKLRVSGYDARQELENRLKERYVKKVEVK